MERTPRNKLPGAARNKRMRSVDFEMRVATLPTVHIKPGTEVLLDEKLAQGYRVENDVIYACREEWERLRTSFPADFEDV